MPKILFYAGIVFTLLIAVIVSAEVAGASGAASELLRSDVSLDAASGPSAGRLIILLLVTVPVAALFLRIASLIAPRDFFASIGACCATTASIIVLAAIVVLRLLGVWLISREPAAGVDSSLQVLREIDVAVSYLVAFFVSLSIFSLRPYFRLRGPLHVLLVSAPAPLFAGLLFDRFALGSESGELLVAFLISVSVSLTLIAAHSLRHRHLFLEITSLRDLLEGRSSRRGRPGSRREPFDLDRGVAFDG